MKPYLLVAADFVLTGGMDRANYALALYLARQGNEVHLVTHRAVPELAQMPNVFPHLVSRPMNSYLLGGPLLDRAGRRWAHRIAARGGRVVVNGGNCLWGDINWVHYVHAVYKPQSASGILRAAKTRIHHAISLRQEKLALRAARVVFANSERTKRDLIRALHVPEERIRVVYLGTDGGAFRPPSPWQRVSRRASFQWSPERVLVAFVGALGDRRKGFDTLFRAWHILCSDPAWDGDLVVAGAGAELSAWKDRAKSAGMQRRIHFLGFRPDVPAILAACDALVSPARYESYGMSVQEALCMGLPAFVTASAGVAERYPEDLREFLLPDPDDAHDLARRLAEWRFRIERYRFRLAVLSTRMRSYSWDAMAAEMVDTFSPAARAVI